LQDDRDSNLVLLTLKEHYIAHRLLAKIYPESIGCNKAVAFMTRTGKKSSRGYALAMSKVRELNRTSLVRITKSKAAATAWNKAQTAKGTHPLKRPDVIAKATATRNLRNAERKSRGEYLQSLTVRTESANRFTAFNATPEQKQIMVARNTEQATCEHCGVTAAKMAMKQWHWANCLKNPVNAGLNRKQIKERNTKHG
jgi:hypothetical protein